jgi:hypothetical protein
MKPLLIIPIQLKYIFPAGGLLKSSQNTFVKVKLRKVKLKTSVYYLALLAKKVELSLR